MPFLYSIEKRNKAVFLRNQGMSLRTIAKKLNVSLSTVQAWTKKVILSNEQRQAIAVNHKLKLDLGRSRFIEKRKAEKTKTELVIFSQAKKEVQTKKSDSFFIMGLALYWAEGFKKDHSLGFVNSDPVMIKIFLRWLKTYGEFDISNIRLRVQIHEIYRPKITLIESYWSDLLQVPISQFQRPFYQVSKSKPILLDHRYKGLLRIRIVGTRNLFIKILGWLEGIKNI